MALITCPECGKQISEYATVCIGCGAPMEIIQKLLAKKESPVDPIPGKDESSEASVEQQLPHAEYSAEEQIENRIISCIICGTKYEAVDRYCPTCKYPAFALSASIDMEPLRDLMVQYGKASEVDLTLPILKRAYTLSEVEELEKTIPQQTLKELAEIYKKHSEQGNLYAHANLGMLTYYILSEYEYDEDPIQLIKKPAMKGIAEAQLFYGIILTTEESSVKEGVAWIRKAAEQEYVDAQFYLGISYLNGDDVVLTEAAKWLLKAAEKGHADAQYFVGLLYELGEGLEEDYTEAAKWLLKAAEKGHADAQHSLGLLYEDGEGVEQNYTKAAEWYQKAAEQGDADAQKAIERMRREGII